MEIQRKKLFGFNTLKEEVKAETLRILEQTGKKPNLKVDKTRTAKLPGKRISKTGKVYWETRKNRSDKNPMSKI